MASRRGGAKPGGGGSSMRGRDRLFAQGQSNNEIVRTLFIGEKTVKTYVSSILGKLNVPSRTQAALYAIRIGLVSPEVASSTSSARAPRVFRKLPSQ